MSVVVCYIDNERCTFDSEDTHDLRWSDGLLISLYDGREFYIFSSSEIAGDVAREYWKDMAENDPREFTCIVGEKALIAWGLGQNYAPGSVGVNSLEEWLDLTSTVPEEHWASYDGLEREFKCKHPDYSDYTVAYRHN